MKQENALKKSEQAIEELSTALAEGRSDKLVSYLDMLSRFHHYSFGNCMLIAMQRPDATYVAGFKRWKQLKRHVKKGEKGIMILAPIARRKSSDERSEELKRQQDERDQETAVAGFRAVYVFDVSQTDGKDLPEFSRIHGEPGEKLATLQAIVASHGITLSYVDSLGGPQGVSKGGAIEVCNGLDSATGFAVLAHELAHEMLHRGDRRKTTTRVIRELEAEAVAYVVCRAAGLDAIRHSADYIQLYTGDQEMLTASLEHIRRVAFAIVDELEATASEDSPGRSAHQQPIANSAKEVRHEMAT